MASPATARHLPTSAFAIMRAGVGIASLLAPIESARFFGVDTIHGSRIIFRLFGARELVLGGMLWRAQTAATSTNASEKDRARQTMRTLLYFGLLIDAIDVVSSTVCIGEGSMGGRAIWLVGVGAAAFAGLGVVGLRAIE